MEAHRQHVQFQVQCEDVWRAYSRLLEREGLEAVLEVVCEDLKVVNRSAGPHC